MKRLLLIATITPFLRAMEHVPAVVKDLPQGVQNYLQALPKIELVTNDDPQHKAQVIIDYLFLMGGYTQPALPGRELLMQKVLACIQHNAPIIRCIPAFPAASSHKVPTSDEQSFSMGDFVGLLTRNHISHEIARVHKPGSFVIIYWEPFVLELSKAYEELGVSALSRVRIIAYQRALKNLVCLFEPFIQTSTLGFDDLNELYARKYAQIPVEMDPELLHHYETFFREDLESCRDLVRRKLFAQRREELEKCFSIIKGASFDEVQKLPIFKKIQEMLQVRSQLETCAKHLAILAYQGGRRMALLMENEVDGFHQQIRESCIPNFASVQKKIYTQIIYGAKGTPWHNVLVTVSLGTKERVFLELVPLKRLTNPTVMYYHLGDYALLYVER